MWWLSNHPSPVTSRTRQVKHASVSDPTYTDAILSPGKLKLGPDNAES